MEGTLGARLGLYNGEPGVLPQPKTELALLERVSSEGTFELHFSDLETRV